MTTVNRGWIIGTVAGFCHLLHGQQLPTRGLLVVGGPITVFKSKKAAQAAVKRSNAYLRRVEAGLNLPASEFRVYRLVESPEPIDK